MTDPQIVEQNTTWVVVYLCLSSSFALQSHNNYYPNGDEDGVPLRWLMFQLSLAL